MVGSNEKFRSPRLYLAALLALTVLTVGGTQARATVAIGGPSAGSRIAVSAADANAFSSSGNASMVASAPAALAATPPKVTVLSPTAGPTTAGTVVTVTGTALTGATKVVFGTVAGTALTVVSATQVKVTAPAHAAGVVDVRVTTPGGMSAVVAADKYTYTAAPKVTLLAPKSGSVNGGTVVTVTGTALAKATTVTFGGTAGTSLVLVSATQVKVTSPAHAAGAVDVRVTTAGGTSAVVTADKYTYNAALPVVSGLSPAAGSIAGGTVVTVTGTGLTGATKVAFAGVAGTGLSVVSATQLIITSPAHAAAVVDVRVTTPGGTSAVVAADKYTYAAAPTVSGTSPATGPSGGGTVVLVTGTALTGATAVTFGGIPGTALTAVSATQLAITSPAHAAGVVDIVVTTPGGASATVVADRFTYTATPMVLSLSPMSGPIAGGTVVTVSGSDLNGATAVRFGTTAGTGLTVASATQLTVTAPGHAVGTVDVTVVTPGGTSAVASGDQFTYVAPPTVTSVLPAAGPTAGGTVVTVTGTNLGAATAVAFGGIAGTGLTVVSATQLTVNAPAHSAGTVDVVVSTPGGTSAVSVNDRFTFVPGPAISSVSPSTGPTGGGTVVTIIGTNLAGATAVTFGGVAGTSLTASASQVRVTAPAHTAGVVDIIVSTPGGTSPITSGDRYTYVTIATECGALGAATTWGASAVHIISCTVVVPTGVTLTIPAGTVVKPSHSLRTAILVQAGGTLTVAGTGANPVVFTSYADDTIGGDTNSDGSATTPAPRDAGQVIVVDSQATVHTTDMIIRYAQVGVSDTPDNAGPGGTLSATVSVSGGSIENSAAGIALSGARVATLTVNGTTFSNDDLPLASNAQVDAIANCTFTSVPGTLPAINIINDDDVSQVVLSGPTANVFNGLAAQRLVVFQNSSLPPDTPWLISSATGAIYDFHAVGMAQVGDSFSQGVLVGGRMTIAAGTIAKFAPPDGPGIGGPGLRVAIGGTLAIAGTSANPVVFTSLDDDLVAGDTGGSSAPGPGHAGIMIVVDTGSTLTSTDLSARYASAVISDAPANVFGDPTAQVSITGGSIGDSLSGFGFSTLAVGILTVTGTTFTNDQGAIGGYVKVAVISGCSFVGGPSGGPAIDLMGDSDVSGVALSGPNANTFTGPPRTRLVTFEDSILTSGRDWTISSAGGAVFDFVANQSTQGGVVVNGAMTVVPGTLVKLGRITIGSGGPALHVAAGGTLAMSGTGAAPTIFTALTDDSVGGDTNADGSASTPLDDGGTMIQLDNGATVTSSGVTMRHARFGITDWPGQAGTPQSVVSVTGGSMDYSDSGIYVVTVATLAVTGTTYTNDAVGIYSFAANSQISGCQFIGGNFGAGPAMYVGNDADVSSVVLSGNGANTFTGSSAQRLVKFENNILPSGTEWSIDSSHGAIFDFLPSNYTGSPQATGGVVIAGTMSVGPGTAVKLANHSANDPALRVASGGRLAIAGTAAAPVSFTSLSDDSVDGDTNADGNATAPGQAVAGLMIALGNGSNVTATHLVARYALYVISDPPLLLPFVGDGTANVTVSDSQMNDSVAGVLLGTRSVGTLTVTASTFTNNQLAIYSSAGYDAIAGCSFVDGPLTGLHSIGIYGDSNVAGVQFSGPTANTFSGSPRTSTVQFVGSTLPAGTTWTIDSNAGAIYDYLALGSSTVSPPDRQGIQVEGTMTVAAGTLTKLTGWNGRDIGDALRIGTGGKIIVAGTSSSPAIFTSSDDDSVGGDTNHDASASTPAAGDAGLVFAVSAGGSADLDGVEIRYAAGVLSVDDSASSVVLHGSVATSHFGVTAGAAFVDATHVDWGDPSGPAPVGSGVPNSGLGVFVTPWIGYTAPSSPPANTHPYVPPTTYTCAPVAFIGVRGSGEPPQGNPPTFTDPSDGLGAAVSSVRSGFTTELALSGVFSPDIKVLGVQYPAVSAFSLVNYVDGALLASTYEGTYKLAGMIGFEEANCPSEKLVLAGYSQGALAIHILLNQLADQPQILSHIAAVILIADPSKVANASEETWDGDGHLAGPDVTNSNGVYTLIPGLFDQGPLPAEITTRTLAICHSQDLVCDPGIPSYVEQHTNYSPVELADMGQWAADRYLGIQPPF